MGRFELIARLGDNTSPEAVAALAELRHAPIDGYSDGLKRVSAEQQRKRVEEAFQPATLDHVAALTRDEAPRSAADLQAVILEELEVIQRQLRPGGDAGEPWRGFFNDKGDPHGEERCRDHLHVLLRERMLFGITLRPEGHLAADKEADLVAELGNTLMVPIEIKGQWHRDLWHAADTQLDRLYAADWRADRRGIYLALWFGDAGKRLAAPPRGTPRPTTPGGLREALIAKGEAARQGQVEIVVLDLSRQE